MRSALLLVAAGALLALTATVFVLRVAPELGIANRELVAFGAGVLAGGVLGGFAVLVAAFWDHR